MIVPHPIMPPARCEIFFPGDGCADWTMDRAPPTGRLPVGRRPLGGCRPRDVGKRFGEKRVRKHSPPSLILASAEFGRRFHWYSIKSKHSYSSAAGRAGSPLPAVRKGGGMQANPCARQAHGGEGTRRPTPKTCEKMNFTLYWSGFRNSVAAVHCVAIFSFADAQKRVPPCGARSAALRRGRANGVFPACSWSALWRRSGRSRALPWIRLPFSLFALDRFKDRRLPSP